MSLCRRLCPKGPYLPAGGGEDTMERSLKSPYPSLDDIEKAIGKSEGGDAVHRRWYAFVERGEEIADLVVELDKRDGTLVQLILKDEAEPQTQFGLTTEYRVLEQIGRSPSQWSWDSHEVTQFP